MFLLDVENLYGIVPIMQWPIVTFFTLVGVLSPSYSTAGSRVSPKVHAEAYEAFGGAEPVLKRSSFAKGKSVASPKVFSHTVYAYLPYWSDAGDVPWQNLSHLSYFSVALNDDGTLGEDHGWDTSGGTLVSLGHSYGAKVTLTLTCFDDVVIENTLASPTKRQVLIDALIDKVGKHGADGVNIDFEFVPRVSKDDFVTFMSELTSTFHSALPGSHISIATPAIDWNGAYDYDQLAENSDALLIMGYGYHWQGGPPGPLSPIGSGDVWPNKNLQWTIDDYIAWGGTQNRHKFVLGLPLYGRDWPSIDFSIPGQTLAGEKGSAISYTKCDDFFAVEKLWDEDSQTPFHLYSDAGEAHHLFCEDENSMAAKFDLIVQKQLGGVMYWALGYVSSSNALWSLSDERFATTGQEPSDSIDENQPGSPDSPNIPEGSETGAGVFGGVDIDGQDAALPAESSAFDLGVSAGCASQSPPALWLLLVPVWFCSRKEH